MLRHVQRPPAGVSRAWAPVQAVVGSRREAPDARTRLSRRFVPIRLCRPIGRAPSARMSGGCQARIKGHRRSATHQAYGPAAADLPGRHCLGATSPAAGVGGFLTGRRRPGYAGTTRRSVPPPCRSPRLLRCLKCAKTSSEAGWRNRHGGVPSRYTQGRRLEKALADSDVDRPRCSSSMRVMRRNSSRSWPVMTACSWASAMATG